MQAFDTGGGTSSTQPAFLHKLTSLLPWRQNMSYQQVDDAEAGADGIDGGEHHCWEKREWHDVAHFVGMATSGVVACCITRLLAVSRPACEDSASSCCSARHALNTATTAAGASPKASPLPPSTQVSDSGGPACCSTATCEACLHFIDASAVSRWVQIAAVWQLAQPACVPAKPALALGAACTGCHRDPAPNRHAFCAVQAAAAPRRRLDGPAGCCTATATAFWSWATPAPWSRATSGLWTSGRRPPQWGPSSRKPSNRLGTPSGRRM